MRFVFVIIAVAAIAVAMVHMRGEEFDRRHELQAQQMRQDELRKRLWEQQVLIGKLTETREIRRKAMQLPLELTSDHNSRQPGSNVASGNR